MVFSVFRGSTFLHLSFLSSFLYSISDKYPMLGCPRKLVNGWEVGYNLLVNGVYWGYNPFTNHLLTSWDIQVGDGTPLDLSHFAKTPKRQGATANTVIMKSALVQVEGNLEGSSHGLDTWVRYRMVSKSRNWC